MRDVFTAPVTKMCIPVAGGAIWWGREYLRYQFIKLHYIIQLLAWQEQMRIAPRTVGIYQYWSVVNPAEIRGSFHIVRSDSVEGYCPFFFGIVFT
jgi:hypothetical protein